MDKVDVLTCSKCGKRYKRIIIRYPARLEETRFWDTFYCCPHCKEAYSIHLASDEDVRTSELEEKE